MKFKWKLRGLRDLYLTLGQEFGLAFPPLFLHQQPATLVSWSPKFPAFLALESGHQIAPKIRPHKLQRNPATQTFLLLSSSSLQPAFWPNWAPKSFELLVDALGGNPNTQNPKSPLGSIFFLLLFSYSPQPALATKWVSKFFSNFLLALQHKTDHHTLVFLLILAWISSFPSSSSSVLVRRNFGKVLFGFSI